MNTDRLTPNKAIDELIDRPINTQRTSCMAVRTVLSENFLTTNELALALHKSPRTIQRWQHMRQGPPSIRVGNTMMYRIESVLSWLSSKEVCPDAKRGRRA